MSATVIAKIDRDGNGEITTAEKHGYALRVLNDLSLGADGKILKPRLNSIEFPSIGDMKLGLGEIRIEFDADLPSGGR